MTSGVYRAGTRITRSGTEITGAGTRITPSGPGLPVPVGMFGAAKQRNSGGGARTKCTQARSQRSVTIKILVCCGGGGGYVLSIVVVKSK